jgi:hypothetical protein
MKLALLTSVGSLCLLAAPSLAFAQFANVHQSRLGHATDTITFGQIPIGSYAYIPFAVSGGLYGGSDIVFGSYFAGQTLQGVDPVTIPEPSAPGQPLQLLYDSNNYVQITNDAASPNNPVLAGGPITFSQPVSILFTSPVAAVGLTAGYLDSLGTLTIDAYTADGKELGTVTSDQTGFEQFGLIATGDTYISGLTIQSTDPAGFGIDDVFLSAAVPEPAGIAILAVGLPALLRLRRRDRP